MKVFRKQKWQRKEQRLKSHVWRIIHGQSRVNHHRHFQVRIRGFVGPGCGGPQRHPHRPCRRLAVRVPEAHRASGHRGDRPRPRRRPPIQESSNTSAKTIMRKGRMGKDAEWGKTNLHGSGWLSGCPWDLVEFPDWLLGRCVHKGFVRGYGGLTWRCHLQKAYQ